MIYGRSPRVSTLNPRCSPRPSPQRSNAARRKRHWEGFVRRNRLPAESVTFEQTQEVIASLVVPALKLARRAPR